MTQQEALVEEGAPLGVGSAAGAGFDLRLITITLSHYSEKARWALERQGVHFSEEGHLAVFHLFATRSAGGARTVPKLVIERKGAKPVLINESAEIVQYADEKRLPGRSTLFPEEKREEIDAWVTKFDKSLGPHVRRWAYYHAFQTRHAFELCYQGGTSWLERTTFWLIWPLLKMMYRRAFTLTEEACARSLGRLEDIFAEVDRALADGRKYLTGDCFTAADLTFAALAYPAIIPPNMRVPALPSLSKWPAEMRKRVEAWRERPFGKVNPSTYRIFFCSRFTA